VYLVGDSLVLQAADYWVPLMARSGWDARQDSFPGTNTCDWFQQMRKQRDQFRPQVVAIEFGGNDTTRCMHHADGSKLDQTELLAKYRRDTSYALDIWGANVSIYVVAPPAMYDGDNRFPPIYRALAQAHPNVHFVDGGRLLTPHRDWRKTAPCLPGERCTGPIVNGVPSNVIRSADRVHFCPVRNSVENPCPVYSPGAARFARTIAQAITRGERRGAR
jgi:hypothetical protein